MKLLKGVFLFVLVSVCLVAATYFVACHKVNMPEDIGYTNEQAVSEKSFNDASTIADQAANSASSGAMNYRTTQATIGGCATITKDSAFVGGVMTYTVTTDFGPTDCLCKDGRYRRGAIIVVHSGKYYDSGAVHTITFNNFYQNDNKITGTKTVTNLGHNTLGQPYFSVVVDGQVALANGGTMSVNWNRIRTWTEGYNTVSDPTDDMYSISGSGKLTRVNGNVVQVNIPDSTPLTVAYGCRYIESGTIYFICPDGKTRSLNYGNSPACDPEAVVTYADGTIKYITLP
jgi:hypothetical protein